jgi:hypothetical protein
MKDIPQKERNAPERKEPTFKMVSRKLRAAQNLEIAAEEIIYLCMPFFSALMNIWRRAGAAEPLHRNRGKP